MPTVPLALLVSRTLPHLFLEAGYRHRVPLEPSLIMMAASGLVRLMPVEGKRAVRGDNRWSGGSRRSLSS